MVIEAFTHKTSLTPPPMDIEACTHKTRLTPHPMVIEACTHKTSFNPSSIGGVKLVLWVQASITIAGGVKASFMGPSFNNHWRRG
jgi:hypothetical protein